MNQDGSISFAFGQGATPAGDFKPLPVGDYRCVAESVKNALTGNHHPKLITVLVVVEGPHQGRKFWEHTTMTPAAENFVLAYFQAFGFQAQAGGQINCNTQDIVGRYCVVKVTGHHEHEGKQQMDFILMPDTAGAAPAAMAPRAAPPAQQQIPGQPQAAPPAQPLDQQQAFMQPAQPAQQPGFGQGTPIPVNPPAQTPPPPAPPQSPQNGGLPNPPF